MPASQHPSLSPFKLTDYDVERGRTTMGAQTVAYLKGDEWPKTFELGRHGVAFAVKDEAVQDDRPSPEDGLPSFVLQNATLAESTMPTLVEVEVFPLKERGIISGLRRALTAEQALEVPLHPVEYRIFTPRAEA